MSMLLKIFQGFLQWLRSLIELLPPLRNFWKILQRMHMGLCRWLRGRGSKKRTGCCVDIPASEYKRPDPLLYSQYFLMKWGLAVTWDNPDIQLYDHGTPISSYNLQADHDYEVVVQVWNNSYAAPAANLPVYLSYLSFGVGTAQTFVGKTHIDLGVKASSQCPAFAKFTWRTPKTLGHYCLQVFLDWPDDANPDNNLGQENTSVGIMQSPASFTFTVKNAATVSRNYRLEADMYQLPQRDPCRSETSPNHESPQMTRLKESQQRWANALETQGYGKFPVSSEWQVKMEPGTFTLTADQEITVKVQIEYTAGKFNGQQAFNINAFASSPHQESELAGGVTLIVRGEK